MKKSISPLLLQVFLEQAIEKELTEFNAVGGGNIVGYSAPLGMDMTDAHKVMWSGDKPESKTKRLKERFDVSKGLEGQEEFRMIVDHPEKGEPIPFGFATKKAKVGHVMLIQDEAGGSSPESLIKSIVFDELTEAMQRFAWGEILVDTKTGNMKLKFYKSFINKDQPRPSLGVMMTLQEEIPVFLNKIKEYGAQDSVKTENVLDKMGYKKAPSTREPYGQTYLQPDDQNLGKDKKILGLVKKNLDKKAYTLSNPPSMGLSIKNPKLKDR